MWQYKEYRIENLGGRVEVCVSNEHTFGTDAFLLSSFAAPKKKEIACDLGCGCGIIPLLWFRDSAASPSFVYLVDIQDQAVELSRISAQRSGLVDRVSIIQADLKILKSLPKGNVDLVTCNPPYKAKGTGVASRAESDLIARHEMACGIDDVCACASRLLRFGGRLCLCCLPERLPDVMHSMRRNKIEPKRLRFVHHKSDTPPWLFLIEGRLGGGVFLNIEAPLIMSSNDGMRIYGE